MKKVEKIQSSTVSSERKGRSPKSARAAGLQFERDLANLLRHIFPEAERQLEFQASCANGVDLQGTDIFDFQCKNRAGYASVSTINEIKNSDPKRIPVLVTKGIRMEAMAVLPLEKLVTLLEVAYGLRPLLGDSSKSKAIEAEQVTATEIEQRFEEQAKKVFKPMNDLLLAPTVDKAIEFANSTVEEFEQQLFYPEVEQLKKPKGLRLLSLDEIEKLQQPEDEQPTEKEEEFSVEEIAAQVALLEAELDTQLEEQAAPSLNDLL